jgi:creatinine amidohydrolase
MTPQRSFIARAHFIMALGCFAGAPDDGSAQALHVAELNTRQIAQLKHERTVVVLPFGILEQHGPYLPSFTDGYAAERLTKTIADTLAARGWTALVFPIIPLGHGGANVIGGKFVFAGSYTVRAATVRAIAMDLLTELGEQGFSQVIAVSLHGAPDHNRALAHAAQYFNDEFHGRMLNLFDVVFLKDVNTSAFPSAALAADGFSVHAGLRETSRIMFLEPNLVSPDLTSARPLRGDNMSALTRIARAPDWPGYFGAPAFANAASGQRSWNDFAQLSVSTALQFVSGTFPSGPRYTDVVAADSANRAIDSATRTRDRSIEERQRRWLERARLSAPR